LHINNGVTNGAGEGLVIDGSGDIRVSHGGSLFFGAYNYAAGTYIRAFDNATGFQFFVDGSLKSELKGSSQTSVFYGQYRFSHQQNAGSRLELFNNRQDLSNVEVYRIAAYNSVEVTGVHFYRGGGGNSGYTKIFAKKNNASSLEEVVQFGQDNALTTTFAGDVAFQGTTNTYSGTIGQHPNFTQYAGLWNTKGQANNASRYMILNAAEADGYRTYVNGDEVYIRAGQNSTTGQLIIRTTGATFAGNVNATNVDITGDYKIDGNILIGTTSTYTIIRNPEETSAIFLGDSADLSNYYDNNAHYWRASGGGSIRMSLQSTNGRLGLGVTSAHRTLDVRNDGMSIFGTGDYTELMLRGQVEGTGTVRSVGSFHWSIRGDVGGDNDDLKLLRFVTGTYNGIVMQVQNSTGRVAIGGSTCSANTLTLQGTATEMDMTNTSTNGRQYRFESDSAGNFIIKDRTANADRILLDNTGKVKICNTGATNIGILQLSSSTNDYFLRGGTHFGYLSYHTGGFHRWFGSDTAEDMRLDSSGRLGIGTTSPQTKLDVFDSGASVNIIRASNATQQIAIGVNNSSGGAFLFVNTNHALRFGCNGSEVGRFSNTGNFGIGTNSPQGILHLNKNSDHSIMRITAGDSSIAGIDFGKTSDIDDARIRYYNSTRHMEFFVANGERMRITQSGNILINRTSDATNQALQVHGFMDITNVSNSAIRWFDGSNFRGGLGLDSWGTGGNSTDMILYAVNNLFFVTGGGNTKKMSLNTAGTLTVKDDVIAFGSPSDRRLKENIKPIESALDKVSKLEGVTFDWKKSDSILDIKKDIGFIAQDVQKVVPELVRENNNGMLSMRHQGMTPILLEAIKELKAEIEELKKQIK